MLQVLIFEPDSEGHRLQVVRAIIDALAGLPVSIVLVTAHDARHGPEYAAHLSSVASQFQLDDSARIDGKGALRSAITRFLALRAALRRHKPDHVFVPYGDGIAQVLGLIRPLQVGGAGRPLELEVVMMRGRGANSPGLFRLKPVLVEFALRLAPIQRIHHIDPVVFQRLMRWGGMAKRIHLLPEPIEELVALDRQTARLGLGIPSDGRYIGCLGGLDRRKGIDLLVDAFASASRLPDDRLLLAGKFEPGIKSQISGEFGSLIDSGQLILMDKYMTQEEFACALSALDVVCAPYPRHAGSSGIVLRAAVIGRPVLCSDVGWVGLVTKRIGLGHCCNVLDRSGFSTAIRRALDEAASFSRAPAAEKFCSFHSVANFGAHITARLRDRLGISPSRSLASFEWASVDDHSVGTGK